MYNVYHCLKRKLFFIVLLFATVLSSFSGMAGTPKAAPLKDTIIPVINYFSPTSANTGDFVTIYGQHLSQLRAVSFGGTPATYFGVVSDTEIHAEVGRGSSGIISITTLNGTATKPGFTYLADTFPPVVSYFTPDSGKLGTPVMIYGVHFTKASKVTFGGGNAFSFTVLNDSTISAVVGNGASGNVAVTTPFGTGAKSGFVFIPSDTVLTKLYYFTPTSANTGDLVTIYGKNLSGTTAVSFGGTPATYVGVVYDSVIHAVVGKGSSGDIRVTATYGIATIAGFTYLADTFPPVVSYFTPDSGKLGTPVMIYGVHFTKASKVTFGGGNAFSFSVLNDSTISAVVGNGASGNVAVTTLFGTGTKSGFVFIPSDTVLTKLYYFTPTSGKTGTLVDIYGKNLSGTTAVSFGGTPATYVGVVYDSLVHAVVGKGSSGDIRVTATYGTATIAGFTYIPDSTTIARVNTAAETADQNNRLLKLELYPNPAAAYAIAIHPASTHSVNLQLIDLSGRVVKTIKVAANTVQTKIPVNGLITGTYKLVWSDGKNKMSNTLLIK